MPARKLTLEALEVIDAIERRGSFARAAEELGRATSALSYTVQKLEEQLGVTLYERQGRKSVLTPAGRLLLEEGRKILQASETLVDRASELASGWEARIRIALESTCAREPFFNALAEFLTQHPSIEIDIIESVLNGSWEALEYNRVDLLVGALGPAPQHRGIRAQLMPSPNMLLVASRDHPLVALRDAPEKLQAGLANTRRVVTHDTANANVLRSAGLISSPLVTYVQTLEQKIAAQIAGVGVGHLPEAVIKPYLQSGELVVLATQQPAGKNYMAWKLSNRGKGLRALTGLLSAVDWNAV